MKINFLSLDTVNCEIALDGEKSLFIFQGRDSDKCLDEVILKFKQDYYSLSPYGHKNDEYLSESDLMVKKLDEFISRLETADTDAPAFIYGIFDKIDLGVDISPYLQRLSRVDMQIFISVGHNYPSERFNLYGAVFKTELR